jgi:hypothetical protein
MFDFIKKDFRNEHHLDENVNVNVNVNVNDPHDSDHLPNTTVFSAKGANW